MAVILVLHLVPCSDTFGATKTAAEVSVSYHHEQQHKADECTPFCTCSCCTVYSVVREKIEIKHPPLAYVANYSLFRPDDYKNVSLSIWQPPQLLS